MSHANEDRDFFIDLSRNISLLETQDHDRALPFFVKELYEWLKNKESLSTNQHQLLRDVVLQMKNREELHNHPHLAPLERLSSLLDPPEISETTVRQLKTTLSYFFIHEFSNTYHSGLPKGFKEILASYFSIPEIIRLQILSKASLKETGLWFENYFPAATLPISEIPHGNLRDLPGYSAIFHYKEAVAPIEAARTLCHLRACDKDLSPAQRQKIKARFAAIASTLDRNSRSYRLLTNLDTVLTDSTACDFLEELLSDMTDPQQNQNIPYSIELFALILACQKHPQGFQYILAEKFLCMQHPTIGLTEEKKGGLRKLPPTAKDFVEYRKLRLALFHRNSGVPTAILAFDPPPWPNKELSDHNASNPWSTLGDKRIAADFAYEAKDYSRASHWIDQVVNHSDATLVDRKNAVAIALKAEDCDTAAYWSGWVADHLEATLDDQRVAALAARVAKNYPGAFRRYEFLANHPEATLEDIRDAADTAAVMEDYSKSCHWSEIVASHAEATLNDKRRARNMAFQLGDKEKTLFWAKAAVDHEGSTVKELIAYNTALSKYSLDDLAGPSMRP